MSTNGKTLIFRAAKLKDFTVLNTTASSDQHNFGLRRHRNTYIKAKVTFFLNNKTRQFFSATKA